MSVEVILGIAVTCVLRVDVDRKDPHLCEILRVDPHLVPWYPLEIALSWR